MLAAFAFMVPAVAAMAGAFEGKWLFNFDTEGGPREFMTDFKLDGEAVTGKWVDQDVVKGTFAGNNLKLEFEYESPEVGKGTLTLTGKLESDTLSGDWKFQEYSGTFKATRPKGISGKWAFVLDTEGGPREAPAEFSIDGATVGGTWGAQPAKGSFENGELKLEFDFDSDEVGKGVMKIDGKLENEDLTRNWKFQEYSGTFKATRPKV